MFKMNKHMGAFFALTIAAGAAQAQDASNFSGYVSLGATSTSGTFDNWGEEYNPWRGTNIGAGASFALSGGNSIDVELNNWQAADNTSEYVTTESLAVVGYNMTNGALTYGGFAGALVHSDYYDYGIDTDLILGAKLGYALSDTVTINAQLGTLSQMSGYFDMGRVNFGSIAASVQATDALRLTASIGAVNGQVGDGSDNMAAVRTYALEAAYRINNGPTEIYANVSGYDSGEIAWGNSQTIGLGVKINLGGKSMAAGKVMDLSSVAWMRETGTW